MGYVLNDEVASDMFWDQIPGGGSSYIECCCGIEHFATDPYEYDDEEHEEGYTLPEPSDKVVHHVGDSVYYAYFNGMTFVNGCVSCGERLKRYEDFIWESRYEIRHYLKTRIDREKEWADQENICNILAGIT